MVQQGNNRWLPFSFKLPPMHTMAGWQYGLLLIVIFFSCYYGLAAYPILDMNEGLYAEIAREMLVNHHWIIPHLNNVPYLEKPPLLYWLIALSYHIFGINAFAARLVPATATALTALSLFFMGYQLKTPQTGWIAALILLSSLVFIIIGRTVFFDMLLTFCFSGTLISFYLWYEKRRQLYLYASYGLLALALLSKGLMAIVMVVPIVLIFLLIMNAKRDIYRQLLDYKAIILFTVIALPWHLLAMMASKQFFYEYFINNQILRYFNARLPHDYHTGPIYYYLPRLIAYLLPWSIGILCTLRWAKPLYQPLTVFLWTWVGFLLIFFSLSGDKGDYYLIVATPALAYLLAQKIASWFADNHSKWLITVFILFATLLLAVGIIGLLFYQAAPHAEMGSHQIPLFLIHTLSTLLLAMAMYSVIGIYLIFKNCSQPLLPFLLLVGFIMPTLLFYLTIKEKTQIWYSQKQLATYVHAQHTYRSLYLYQNFAAYSSFVFYIGKTAKVIDNKSPDLQYGQTTAAGKKQFITLPQFLAHAKQRPIYLVMLANRFSGFQKSVGASNHFCIMQSNGKVSLISNQLSDCQVTLQTAKGLAKPLSSTLLKKLS